MSDDILKRCSKCGQEKPRDDFYNSIADEDGKKPDCKACYTRGTRKKVRQTPLWREKKALDAKIAKLNSEREDLVFFEAFEADREPKMFEYIRVSDDKQVDSGLGLQAQDRRLHHFSAMIAESNDIDPKATERFSEEGVSAAKIPLIERPAGKKLNSKLRRGDHVVFAKVDRCFRNQKDFVLTQELFNAKGVKMHFADLGIDTSTPQGEMMLTTLVAFAQLESRQTGERVKESVAAGRQNGYWAGPSPAGYESVRVKGEKGRKRLRIKYELTAYMRLIFRYRHTYRMPFEQISDAIEVAMARKQNRKPYHRITCNGKNDRYFKVARIRCLYRNYCKHTAKVEPLTVEIDPTPQGQMIGRIAAEKVGGLPRTDRKRKPA